jgi:NAD(P)-dependent dehydrogenase (short-subunit alcohol dehydrogenase family)
MGDTIVVCGHGPGVSDAVARRFGSEGFSVALVARNAARLEESRKALEGRGIRAATFPTDMADPEAVRTLVGRVRATLGPITAIHWNSYAMEAGDVLEADVASIRRILDVSVTSLVVAVQEALPDLRASKGAVLVTNGGFGIVDPQVDALVVKLRAMGLGIGNAAKLKLTRLLAERLRPDGIHVGEVMIGGLVKGTAWDDGSATIEPATVAQAFWNLWSRRAQVSITIR